jgi:hypothetical protein
MVEYGALVTSHSFDRQVRRRENRALGTREQVPVASLVGAGWTRPG